MLNGATQRPLEDVTVRLYKHKRGFLSLDEVTIQKKKTNKDGEFVLRIRADEDRRYYLIIEKEGFWSWNYIGYTGLDDEFDVFTIFPIKEMQLRVVNVPPSDAGDEIEGYCFPGSPDDSWFAFEGHDVDEQFTVDVEGGRFVHVKWEVLSGGVETSFEDSIFCSVDGPCSYTISY